MQIELNTGRPILGTILAEYVRAFSQKRGKGDVERALSQDSLARVFLRAASEPLGLPGDGSDSIVATTVLEYVRALPGSIAAELARRVLNVDVSHGKIVIPGKDETATGVSSAGWIMAADPIPVVMLGLIGTTLTAYKAASITVCTLELAKNRAAQPIIENLQREDIRTTLDNALLDGQAGTDARPPSLLYGATAVPASGDLVADLTALFAAVPGCVSPLLLISRGAFLQASAAMLVQNGQIGGADCIISDSVPAATPVVLVDGADCYVTAGNDFDIAHSDQAVLHMSNPASPIIAQNDVPAAVPSSPVTSLWQQGLIGCRVVLPVGWNSRPGRVAFLQSSQA